MSDTPTAIVHQATPTSVVLEIDPAYSIPADPTGAG